MLLPPPFSSPALVPLLPLAFLLVLATLSTPLGVSARALLLPAGEECVKITMSTPTDCVDNVDFLDFWGYTCIENGVDVGINDCYADNIVTYELTAAQAEDILVNCPLTCGICSGVERMSVEVVDSSTGDTLYTVDGPFFDAPATTSVTQTVCLPTPSCFKIRVTAPSFNYLARARFDLVTVSDGVQLASAESLARGTG